jgi:CheY-like chemotaxis protein
MIKPIHILLADDDEDDRFFFNLALRDIPFPTQLTVMEDGEKLMNFLSGNEEDLPEILFLDLNMPRKNGSECLTEIKQHEKLKGLPVIIHSTSMHDHVADVLYCQGAHYYNKKTDVHELQLMLIHVLSLLSQKKLERPARNKFVLSFNTVHLSQT